MIKQFLIKKLYRIKHGLGLNYYFYPQKYDCSYVVSLKNSSNSLKKFLLIIPVPQNSPSQTIEKITISEQGKRGVEEQYKNHFFYCPITVGKNEEKKIVMTFAARVALVQADASGLNDIIIQKNNTNNRFISVFDEIKNITNKKTQTNGSVGTKIKQLYEYVVTNLRYGNQILGLYTAKQALTLSLVDCGGYITLLSSLLKQVNILCVPVFGFFANHTIDGKSKNSMHAWGYIPLRREDVFPVDPTEDALYRQGQSYQSGGFGWVGSDRIIFSEGCDLKLEINNQTVVVDIMQNAIAYPPQNSVTIETVFETKKTNV